MKRLSYGMLAVALVLAIPSAGRAYDPPAPDPGTGINETVHDLGHAHNGMSYVAIPEDPLERICIFCHAPHNTYKMFGTSQGGGDEILDPRYDYVPLWNHMYTVTEFTPYENGPGAPGSGPKAANSLAWMPTGQPGGTSMLCLSCHDGVLAVNAYGTTGQPTESRSSGGGQIDPRYVIGQDGYLGNHHPISFDYVGVAGEDLEIRDASQVQLTANDADLFPHLYGSGNNMMECGTCHSVHNTGNTGEKLLWRSDYRSELCLSCHAKGIYTPPPGGPVVP